MYFEHNIHYYLFLNAPRVTYPSISQLHDFVMLLITFWLQLVLPVFGKFSFLLFFFFLVKFNHEYSLHLILFMFYFGECMRRVSSMFSFRFTLTSMFSFILLHMSVHFQHSLLKNNFLLCETFSELLF